MRKATIAVLVSFALTSLASPAVLEASSDRVLLPEADQSDWLAIGRLNIAPAKGHCTATLIEPDVVLTAAHCVIDQRDNRPYVAGKIHFLAGFRQSAFVHHGRAVRVEIAKGFLVGGQPIERDLALVHLDSPVAEDIEPIPLATLSEPNDLRRVSVFSYGSDRAFIASVDDCGVTSRHATMALTSCEAVPGVSGAPLILDGPHGPTLAGVIVGSNRSDMPLNRAAGGAAVLVDPKAFNDLFGGL